jgi:hypothetical protein
LLCLIRGSLLRAHDLQDFISLDRAIPADQAATYGDLAQFPLVGQALVMGYNVPELPLDTHLVRFLAPQVVVFLAWRATKSPITLGSHVPQFPRHDVTSPGARS